MLDFKGLEVESLPRIVGKLIHLRYLGLRYTSLNLLPLFVNNLRSLMLDTNNLKQVPNVICKIQNMRYLYLEGQEDDIPLQIDMFENLQILSSIAFNQYYHKNNL